MLRGMKVLRGMAIGRVVTTANVTTLRADTEMNPAAPTLEAVFTAQCAWLHVVYVFFRQMNV